MDHEGEVNQTLLRLIREEPLGRMRLLDVGCGSGALTFALAPYARFITGIDRSREAVGEAERRAREEGVGNIAFAVADAYKEDYHRFGPVDMVVAHLFMAEEVVEKAAGTLPPGGLLAFACLHSENLKEFGVRSRFSFTLEGLSRILERHGFRVEHLEVEQETESFSSIEEAVERFSNARSSWERSGRWDGLVRHFQGGGREVTHSLLVGKARKGARL